MPLSAHTFLRASSQQPPWRLSTEWKRSYFKKKKLFIRFYETNEAGPCGGGWGAVHTTGWMESNYPALPLGRFPAFRSFPPWRYSTVFPWPPGDQGLVRTVKSSHKSEPQSLVPKRRYSSARKGSDISGAQSVSREDVTT